MVLAPLESFIIPKIIRELEESNLSAECPNCGCGFRLSEAPIFDGLERFPKAAQQRRKALLSNLRERGEDLSKRHKSADITAEKKAIDVGLGARALQCLSDNFHLTGVFRPLDFNLVAFSLTSCIS